LGGLLTFEGDPSVIETCLAVTGSASLGIILVVAVALIAAGVVITLRGRRSTRVAPAFVALALLCALAVTVSAPSAAQAAGPAALGGPCPVDTAPAPVAAPDPAPVSPAGASIGNFAWIDANGNGLQDAGEPPAVGARVTLLDFATGLPVTVGVDGAVIVPTQTTDASGAFLFSRLLPGTYRLAVDSAPAVLGETLSVGVISTIALDSSQPLTVVIADIGGRVIANYDIPFTVDNCLRSVAFSLPGEGHTVSVFNGTNDFTNTPEVVTSILPILISGAFVTPGSANGASDSDFDPTSRQTLAPLTVAEGQQVLTIDLGLQASTTSPISTICL
jgi:SdrD B-like domain